MIRFKQIIKNLNGIAVKPIISSVHELNKKWTIIRGKPDLKISKRALVSALTAELHKSWVKSRILS